MKRNGMRRIAWILVLSLLCGAVLPAVAEDKKETVYAFTDAQGNVKSVTVSERLYNDEGRDELVDVTRLKDIENIGGAET